jgi:ferritin
MKDLLRLRTSLTEEIETLLNEQIKVEAHSSSVYLAMSAWCNRNGFDNSAQYFQKQSGEEREHMLKLFEFVNDMGGRAISPEVTNIPQEFESFRIVFETALQQEIYVSDDNCLLLIKWHLQLSIKVMPSARPWRFPWKNEGKW